MSVEINETISSPVIEGEQPLPAELEAAMKARHLKEFLDDKPNRTRRTIFIFVVTFVSYLTIVWFGIHGQGKLAEMVVDGLTSLMMVTVLSYIAAYSVDSSQILSRLGKSRDVQ